MECLLLKNPLLLGEWMGVEDSGDVRLRRSLLDEDRFESCCLDFPKGEEGPLKKEEEEWVG